MAKVENQQQVTCQRLRNSQKTTTPKPELHCHVLRLKNTSNKRPVVFAEPPSATIVVVAAAAAQYSTVQSSTVQYSIVQLYTTAQ